jgi:hypothetical protein
MDPNEKVAPVGYSAAAFVGVQQPLVYTVYFANETNAAAYARQVGITDTLDPGLDILTFRLTEIAFGGVTIAIPTNQAFYQTRVALPPPNPTNVVVDVSAGVNLESNSVFWTMNAIDLNTGLLVVNAQEGLLPPDNTNHVGEGHVTFTIKPRAGATTGTVVSNTATVVFDTNEPIPTNPTRNTLDAVPPVSTVTTLPAMVEGSNFIVSWFGNDDTNGSGLQSYDIYVSDNGGPFQIWLARVTQDVATFTGEPGHSYGFYSLAIDNAGNVETVPMGPEGVTLVSNNQPPTLEPITDQTVNVGGALDLTNLFAEASNTNEELTYSLQDAPAGATINATNGQILWNPLPSQGGTTNLFTVSVTENGMPPLTTSQSFAVVVGDYVELSLGTVVGQPGDLVRLPINLISTASLTNLAFTLMVPSGRISSLWFQGTTTDTNIQLKVPSLAQLVLTFQTIPGLELQGTQTVGRIWFDIPPNQSPGIATLAVQDPSAVEMNGSTFTNIDANDGRIIVVTDEPLLEAIGLGPNQVQLNMYSQPGQEFDLQTSTNVRGAWSKVTTVTLTNSIQSLIWTNMMEQARYFRLVKE